MPLQQHKKGAAFYFYTSAVDEQSASGILVIN